MAKMLVEVAADISAYLKGLQTSTKATELWSKEVTVDTRAVAQAQVAASIKSTEALKKQAAAYRAVAASAEKGSKEQVVAARLAADAEHRLARAIGETAHQARSAHGHVGALDRDISHAARGALSGSHAIHGLGASLAFASGGFVAFHEAGEFIRESVDAAREAIVSQKALAAQMKASGESFQDNRERIERASLSYGKFGFQNDEVIASLTVLERGTGSISKAISLQGLAADLARAKNLGLAQAANVVAKVFGGQETALRRAVPGLAKNAHGMDLIRLAQAKLAGQAAANTTAAERFQATLHDTQEIIGTALLPTLNKYLTLLSNWLERENRSGDLQRKVASASRLLSEALAALKFALQPVIDAFKLFSDLVGGTGNALKILAAATAAWKLGNVVSQLTLANTEAKTLTGRLTTMKNLGVIAIGVELIEHPPKGFERYSAMKTGSAGQAWKNLGTDLLHPQTSLGITPEDLGYMPSGQRIVPSPLSPGGVADVPQALRNLLPTIPAGLWPKVQKAGATAGQKILAAWAKGAASRSVADELKMLPKGITPEQRNVWFDALVGRELDILQDFKPERQIAALKQIADQIKDRIAATNDVTRQLTLEGNLRAVVRQQVAVQDQLAADAKQKRLTKAQAGIDELTFAAEQLAGDPAKSTQYIAALRRAAAAIQEQIRIQGSTLDLRRQLFDVNQKIVDADKASRDARTKQIDDARQAQLDALQLAVDQAELTPTLDDNLTARQAQAAKLKQIIAAGGDVAQYQSQLVAVEGEIAGLQKQQVDKAQQTRLDALQLAVQRADLTKTLDDNITTREAEANAYRELIRKGGDVAAYQAQLVTLEGEITDLTKQRSDDAKAAAAKAQQDLMDRLAFAVEVAGTTKTLVDDIKRRVDQADAYKKLIAAGKDVVENQRNLFRVEQEITGLQQQRAQNRADARKARQFRLLGLTATGEEIVPGVRQLRGQLQRVSKDIEGTLLDTPRRRRILDGIAKLFADPKEWSKIGRDVRSQVHTILDGIRKELEKAPKRTTPLLANRSISGIIRAAGLDLTPLEARRLGSYLTTLNPSGFRPPHHTAAFAGAGGGGGVTIGTVHVNGVGVRDWGDFENQLTKRAKARAHSRRGA